MIPKSLVRFRREAKAASALNHPNICTIHEIDEDDGKRLHRHGVSGRRRRWASHRGQTVEIEMLLELGIEIADALDAAHAKGSSIATSSPPTFRDQRGHAKILDFGLAKTSHTP